VIKINLPSILVETRVKEETQTETESQVSKQQISGRKRGRKLTEEEKYRKESEDKMDLLRNELKNNKDLSLSERQKIRNQISAQSSRLKKKEEFWELSKTHSEFLKEFNLLSKIID